MLLPVLGYAEFRKLFPHMTNGALMSSKSDVAWHDGRARADGVSIMTIVFDNGHCRGRFLKGYLVVDR